jgi:hypothetical protein
MRVSAMFLSCMVAGLVAAPVHPVLGGEFRFDVAQAPDETNEGGARHTNSPASINSYSSAPARPADRDGARERSTTGRSRPPAQPPAQVSPPPRNGSTQGQKSR